MLQDAKYLISKFNRISQHNSKFVYFELSEMNKNLIAYQWNRIVIEDMEDSDVIDDDNTEIGESQPMSDIERDFFNCDRPNNVEYHDNDTDWNSSIDEFDLDLYHDNVVIEAKEGEQDSEDHVTEDMLDFYFLRIV